MAEASHPALATGIGLADEGRMVFRVCSTAIAVREALHDIVDGLSHRGADRDLCDRTEMVLAEALINVVEHAYGGNPDGCIEVALDLSDRCLRVRLCDSGGPMPGLAIPEGRPHDLRVALADLPEGGFGWFLIRTLTADLAYIRKEGWNCLTFVLPVEDSAP